MEKPSEQRVEAMQLSLAELARENGLLRSQLAEYKQQLDLCQRELGAWRKVYEECTNDRIFQHLESQNKAYRKKVRNLKKQFKQYAAYVGGLYFSNLLRIENERS